MIENNNVIIQLCNKHKRLAYAALFGPLGYEKPQSGLRPLCGFLSATFGAGVNATHCPITCPKRRQPRTLNAIRQIIGEII